MQPRGGYKTITVVQLCNVLAAYHAGRISLRAVRVYFAAFAMVAIREAASRSRQGREDSKELARYRRRELSRLTGLDEPECGKQVRALARAGLIRITETEVIPNRDPIGDGNELAEAVAGHRRSVLRPVPVPRPILRFLSRTDRPALTKILIGYLVRGLTLDRRTGEVRGAGSVKLTWLADKFCLSERGARYARRELIDLGIITADMASTQRKLNRTGAYFAVNLDWSDAVHRESTEVEIAPPVVQIAARIAPPVQDKRTSFGTKDQKTRFGRASGFCGKSSGSNSIEPRPRLSNIQPEDLRRISTLLVLYEQAVSAHWIGPSASCRRNFVAAAVRARRANGHSVKIFVSIIRNRLWHHITNEEEQRANAALNRFDNRALAQSLPTQARTLISTPVREIIARLADHLTHIRAA